jgi:hypothetical protein
MREISIFLIFSIAQMEEEEHLYRNEIAICNGTVKVCLPGALSLKTHV